MADDHGLERRLRDKELLDEIFKYHPDNINRESQSWQDWKAGNSNYKPFSLQLSECNADMTAFSEKCHVCGHELLMCRRFGGQCRSNKCKNERIRNREEL